jgi:hypothetical protein
MKKLTYLFLFVGFLTNIWSQNLTKQQTIEYINKKMSIADPRFHKFEIGDNGEAVFKWHNDCISTEYRFNIREVDITLELSSLGDNYITLSCMTGVNNCLQKTLREDRTHIYCDKITYENMRSLDIKSISGYDNNYSIKGALIYLKVLSINENKLATDTKRDPFLKK